VSASAASACVDDLANGLIAKVLAGVRFLDGREDALTRMSPGETEHTLNEANRAHAPRRECRLSPLREGWADAHTSADETIDIGLLATGGLGFHRAVAQNTPAATRACTATRLSPR
jgi:hypothetical protein